MNGKLIAMLAGLFILSSGIGTIAEAYGPFTSEELVGESLASFRGQTKELSAQFLIKKGEVICAIDAAIQSKTTAPSCAAGVKFCKRVLL